MAYPRMAPLRSKPQKEEGVILSAPVFGDYPTTLSRATILLIAFLALGFTAASGGVALAALPGAVDNGDATESPSASAAHARPPAAVGARASKGVIEQPFREGGEGVTSTSETEADADPDVGEEAAGEGAAAGDASHPLRALACLEGEGGNDNDGARRGVQKRDFLKRFRAELSVLGGHYAADALSSTYAYGIALSAFLSEDFGLEAMLLRNPVQFRLEQPFNSFDREQHFAAGVAWNWLGAMLWSPVHAKLRWSERHITHADILLIAGAGQTRSETAQGLTYQMGVGIKLYLARFFSIRFDVRDLLVPQEVLGRGRSTHNIVTLVGLAGWFPG